MIFGALTGPFNAQNVPVWVICRECQHLKVQSQHKMHICAFPRTGRIYMGASFENFSAVLFWWLLYTRDDFSRKHQKVFIIHQKLPPALLNKHIHIRNHDLSKNYRKSRRSLVQKQNVFGRKNCCLPI